VHWKPSNQACRRDYLPLTVHVSPHGGYLASSVTLVTGQGGRGCPWRLRLSDPAQRLNFTLHSFFVAGEMWTSAASQTGGRRTHAGVTRSNELSTASRWTETEPTLLATTLVAYVSEPHVQKRFIFSKVARVYKATKMNWT